MAQKQFKIGLSNTDKQNMAQDVYERVLALTFAEYDSAETYNEGDFVVYNDLLYKCLADNVTGTWDATKWQQATLQDLLDDIEGAVAFVNDKANVDGNYPTMTVGMADNLTPYDESAGDDQDEPFILQATGTGNGSQPDFATGSVGLMKEKQGNTVVVNQQVRYFRDFDANGVVGSHVDTLYTLNGTATDNINTNIVTGQNFKQGHKYLIIVDKALPSGVGVCVNYSGSYANKIYTANSDLSNVGLSIYIPNGTEIDVSFHIYCIDLTQWFNGDIPQDLLDNPSNFFRYYQGSLAYNEGELVNANGRYIKCIGMNQFDGTNDVKAIPNATYYIYGSATLTYKDKDGSTIGSESKTNETFVAPSNCLSIVVSGSGDISINLYYEDEPRCLTYEPYQVLTNNDTGTEVLRSAGSVKDYKTPDGTIHRPVGVVDLGDLDWSYSATKQYFYATIAGIKNVPSYTTGNGLMSKPYTLIDFETIYNDTTDNAYSLTNGQNNERIYIRDTSKGTDAAAFATSMSGVYLHYELAEPTTEQGTQFSENLVIDDFGSMDFGGTSGVPQGALIFYPVDYKAFVDTLYNYTDGTPSDLAKNSELNTKFESYFKSLSGYDASATQVLKNVEGTLTWVTEE